MPAKLLIIAQEEKLRQNLFRAYLGQLLQMRGSFKLFSD